MNNITTVNVDFSAIDYKNENSLSSYALSATFLTFMANYPNNLNNKLVWDFGDGTRSKLYSPKKNYNFPGQYNVTLLVYDCDNNAQISSFTKTIIIKDFVPFTFEIDSPNSTYLMGQITKLGNVKAYYPPYQSPSDIYYSVSNSDSQNYWDINYKKFVHLERFYTMYQSIFNHSLSAYQYQEIEKVTFDTVPLYGKIQNNSIIYCSSTDQDSFFVGLSGNKDIYYKDDCIKNNVVLDLFFDKTNNVIPVKYKNLTTVDYLNNLSISMQVNVLNNLIDYYAITSNGIDGEGTTIDSFSIDPIKFSGSNISFVVTAKDALGFTNKDYNLTTNLSVSLDIDMDIYDQPNFVEIDFDGEKFSWAKRYYINPNFSSIINTRFQCANNNFLTPIVGSSSDFNIYPINSVDMYKKNENFDASATISDLRFQESMLDKNLFFEDFLGTVLGNSSSDHYSIGKKTYEKISNFVSNTQDIDVCEEDYINSHGDFVGYDNTGDENYKYPEKIKSIINLASIGSSKLIGTTNKFRENFDIKGRSSKDEYGINLGNQIDTSTYIISAGIPIVALEKFSNTYTFLNTEQLNNINFGKIPLSSYSGDWGLPLVLPSNFVSSDLSKYYIFFEYVERYDNTLINGVIDFNNPLTTIPLTANNDSLFIGTNEPAIFDIMFSNTLYNSLALITPDPPASITTFDFNGDFYPISDVYHLQFTASSLPIAITSNLNNFNFDIVSGNNPTLTLKTGINYDFNINSSMPFAIRVSPSNSSTTIPEIYNNNIVSGVINTTLMVTFSSVKTLYYVNTSTPSISGIINITQ